ncbi:hypothetical protein CDL12_12101 [Handroanthus impetiginosus]|uniref:Uncharacterized protein n=1 Tax=Handroanthus impetiginosus TaxID=429701 RepID=A0A2G9HCJ6_9LAMI|nr:hypothetical protein CDL12_12101 [Handroanthus impetiginosus]
MTKQQLPGNCTINFAAVPNASFQVGVILDLDSVVGRVGLSSLSLALSDFYSANTNYSTKLVLHVRDFRGQVIDAAAAGIYTYSSTLVHFFLLYST